MLTKAQEKTLRWLLSLKADIKNTITISNLMTEYPNGYTDKQIIKKLNEYTHFRVKTFLLIRKRIELLVKEIG